VRLRARGQETLTDVMPVVRPSKGVGAPFNLQLGFRYGLSKGSKGAPTPIDAEKAAARPACEGNCETCLLGQSLRRGGPRDLSIFMRPGSGEPR